RQRRAVERIRALRRVGEPPRAAQHAKIAGLELERHAGGGMAGAREASRQAVAERSKLLGERLECRDVAREGGLDRDALRRRVGIDRAVILAAGEARKPAADRAVAGNQFALAPLAQLSDGGDTVARQRM